MATTPAIKSLMNRLAGGAKLDEDEIVEALGLLGGAEASGEQRAAFLMALRVRGESVDEITGAARSLRSGMVRITAPDGAVDIVGTGGDSHGTYNVSTCAAIVAAGAGVTIAKHGNRSVSSKSGASDVLSALGVRIDAPLPRVEAAINQAGIGFLWAPMHHPAMKTWGPVRAELGIRSLFNLLGPICNPAGVKRQVVGVFAREWVEPIAEALSKLGSDHVWVVHGADGMDELTTTGVSTVAELVDGSIAVFEVAPEDAWLPRASLDDLKGGDADENAEAINALLAGKTGAFRDIVLLNAAAALIVGGKAASLQDGVKRAAKSIDSGAARAALDRLISITARAE